MQTSSWIEKATFNSLVANKFFSKSWWEDEQTCALEVSFCVSASPYKSDGAVDLTKKYELSLPLPVRFM